MNSPYLLTGVIFAVVQNALKTRSGLWGVTLCERGPAEGFVPPGKERGGLASSLRHPDPTGREGAWRGKRLSPELEAGSPVAAVYDRRLEFGQFAAVYDRRPSIEDSRRGSAGSTGSTSSRQASSRQATPPCYGNGGHRPPLQNTVWAQRDSTGSGCLSLSDLVLQAAIVAAPMLVDAQEGHGRVRPHSSPSVCRA
jgi:hypothetical protein